MRYAHAGKMLALYDFQHLPCTSCARNLHSSPHLFNLKLGLSYKVNSFFVKLDQAELLEFYNKKHLYIQLLINFIIAICYLRPISF